MTDIPDILIDERTIMKISTVHTQGFEFSIGELSVTTKIEPYEDSGGFYGAWFAVYVGDEIRWRVPAAGMVVEYAPDEEMSA